MTKTTYFDPNFYFVSDRLSYTIRGEVDLNEDIDGAVLQHAVDRAFLRFPYFSVKLVKDENKLVLKKNTLPHIVVEGDEQIILGSEDVNYHLVVVSFSDNKIFFNVSHCITDGIGRAPFTKSVLYYYITEKYGVELDDEGIYLAGSELFDDEEGEPIRDDEVMEAEATYFKKIGQAYKLTQGQLVKDNRQTEYRFCVPEKEFMALNRELNATPNSLASALLAQVAWELNDDIDKNIVVNLCFNLRPGLNNKHNHRFLLSCMPLAYEPDMKDMDLQNICRYSRELINFQKHDENARFICKNNKRVFDKIQKIKSLETKQKVMRASVYGNEGFLSTTFLASYIGKNNLGSLSPYVKAMFTSVDSIPEGGIAVEITSADGFFFFSFIQDFTADVYVNAFINKLKEHGIEVTKLGKGAVMTPKIELPE